MATFNHESQIFELLTGRWLFVPREGPTWTAEAYHLAHMPGVTGEEYDISYFRKGRRYAEYFNDDGIIYDITFGIKLLTLNPSKVAHAG